MWKVTAAPRPLAAPRSRARHPHSPTPMPTPDSAEPTSSPAARGAVACGHPVTRDAMMQVLNAGGNAFDAAAAGLWAACVAEPLLSSLGGGGFLLARPADEEARLYDFFAQTPRRRTPSDALDFREIMVDFGTARQPFHIGLGAAATPGTVAGLFGFHSDLGRLSMDEVASPALAAARDGVEVTSMQAYLARVLTPILDDTPEARATFVPGDTGMSEQTVHTQPELAEFIEALIRHGPDLFYRGEMADAVDEACRHGGGHLRRKDFEAYRVLRRRPLKVEYEGRRILTNPPPASGGLLVAFGLRVLAAMAPGPDPYGPGEARRLALALAAIRDVRAGADLEEDVDLEKAARVLSPETVERYRAQVASHPPSYRGTTHLSVIDGDGNAASLSVSNGEGCGWMIPNTGVMLNNVLGESDLQPRGFGRWPLDTRLTSMMAPTLVENREQNHLLALGSGGSKRIRSAILQVLAGVLDLGLTLEAAVARPRLHLEGSRLEIEGGFSEEVIGALGRRWPDPGVWAEQNLFFGGVHAAERRGREFGGAGDPRRGGVAGVIAGH